MTTARATKAATGSPAVPLPGADAGAPEWVMLARAGAWLGHPATPEVITPERLRSALDYFERHYAAHGADLVVDYHHASVEQERCSRCPNSLTNLQFSQDSEW